MAEKITSRTTLQQIKDFARQDFGVELTTDQAREIKNKGQRGLVVWTDKHIVVSDTSRERGFRVVPGKVL